MSYFRLCLL